MKLRKYFIFGVLLIFFSLNFASAQNSTCVYFFYGNGCQHCAQVEPVLDNCANAESIELHKFEIYNNKENMLLLTQYFDAYNIPTSERGIPVVLIGNNYLIGDKPIIDNLGSLVQQNKQVTCPNL